MPSDRILDVRPRSTGEILDDAWRVYAADAPQLLLLLGLFHVPAFCALLLLVTYTANTPATWVDRLLMAALAALCAALLPLTGVGSGACQEFLRRRADNRPAPLLACLGAALRRGVEHSAARAVLFLGVIGGLLFLLLPGCAVWMYGGTVHALLSDDKVTPAQRWSQFGREAIFDAGKAACVVLCRLPLLLLTIINLHLLVLVTLWAAGNLGGFDVSVLQVQLSEGNPPYLLSLILLAWLLLAPFHEAGNFLLYLDTRVRQEGLDLLYHVQRVFATPERAKAVVGALVGLLVGLSWFIAPAAAAPPKNETRLAAVRAGQQDVTRIADEIRATKTYLSGSRWETQLRAVGTRLSRAWGPDAGQLAWFASAIADFGSLDQQQALGVLSGLQDRLALLEDTMPATEKPEGSADRPRPSKDDVKNLLRPRHYEEEPSSKPEEDPHKDEVKHPEIKHDGPGGGAGGGSGGVIAPGVGAAGFGQVAWMILLGLLIAVVVGALVFLGIHLYRNRSRKPKQPKSETEAAAETEPPPHEQPVAVLWQQAEKLAQDGRYLDALRSLYRAVLSLLHRRQLLRYESTRTNGEYVQEVRLAPQAPAEVREPFERLTNLFERKWYGDRGCESAEFLEGRGLAEEIQSAVRA